MARPYTPPIWHDAGEIRDLLGWMMLASPKFVDQTGYFPGKNIETVFYTLNESLRSISETLGKDRYLLLKDLSHRMRAHFEADPEDKTDDGRKGREIIDQMRELLKDGKSRQIVVE